jgi:Endosomal/lysosomal potassium channel TMEM175
VDDAHLDPPGDGLDFDRLPVFCDAIFAIAITLVAVEIGVPEVDDSTSARELWAAVARDVPTIIAFFITFAILASYWLANHRFMAAPAGIHGRLPHVDDGVPRDDRVPALSPQRPSVSTPTTRWPCRCSRSRRRR